MSTILQVQCSGETLDADENLLSMALYTLADEVVVVSVDLSSQECTTRGAFSACIIDKQDSRRTAIRTLVQDLPQDGSREYGCDVTSVKPGGRTRIQTWSYTLHNESMYMAFVVQCLEKQCFGVSVLLSRDHTNVMFAIIKAASEIPHLNKIQIQTNHNIHLHR